MKTLSTKYRKNGYDHEIIFRERDYCISKLTSIESGRFICLEVFKVKIQKPSPHFSTLTEEVETTPSNEDWGKTGYTVYTIEEAQKKIKWLKEENKTKKKYQNFRKGMNVLSLGKKD